MQQKIYCELFVLIQDGNLRGSTMHCGKFSIIAQVSQVSGVDNKLLLIEVIVYAITMHILNC